MDSRLHNQQATLIQNPFIQAFIFIILASLFIPRFTYSAGGDILGQYLYVLSGKQEAAAVKVDTDGTMIICGFTQPTPADDEDFFTMKITADGNSMLWASPASFDHSGGSDYTVDLTIDSQSNVIVTGSVFNGTNYDFHTIKYNGSTGAVIWQHTYNGPNDGDDIPAGLGIGLDTLDNIYIGGYTPNANGAADYILLKYSSNGPIGGKPVWAKTENGSGNNHDRIKQVAVGPNDPPYIVVTGESSNGSNFDILTVKYDADGNKLWSKVYDGGSGDDTGFTVAVDSNDDVIMTGSVFNGTDDDIYIAKYTGNGASPTVDWQVTYDGGYADVPNELVVDSTDNVYITGTTWTVSGKVDFITAKYYGTGASKGTLAWPTVKVYNSGTDNNDTPVTLAVSDNAVFVTGYQHNSSQGDDDFLTIKYKRDNGNQLWVDNYDSGLNQDDKAVGVGLSSSGDVYVGGWCDRTVSLDSGTASGGSTATIEDSSKSWTTDPDEWTGYYVVMTSGANNGLTRQISSNTGTALTLASAFGSAVGAGDTYYIHDPSNYDFKAIKYDPGALDAPSGLTLTLITETEVKLDWTVNSTGEEGFQVFRKLATSDTYPDTPTLTASGAGTATINDTTVSADTKYTYKIRAYNDTDGEYSNFSDETSILTTNINLVSPSWSYKYVGPDGGDDEAYAIAVGPDLNPVATGYSYSSAGSFDYFTVRLDYTDASAIWEERYDDEFNETDKGQGVVVDSSNNPVVAGFSSLYSSGAGSNTLDFFTLKYYENFNNLGQGVDYMNAPIWDQNEDGPSYLDDRAVAIAKAPDNSFVVVGYGRNSSGNDDIFVVKYASDGSRTWSGPAMKVYDGGGHDVPNAVIFDSEGDIIVTGKTYVNGDYDIFTRKYSGSDGSTIWTVVHDSGDGDDEGNDVTVGSADEVYVTGYISTSSQGKDIITIKFLKDAQGDPADQDDWIKTYNGAANGDDVGEAVRVDPTLDEDYVVTAGTILVSVGNNDFYAVRYSASGTEAWTRILDRSSNNDMVKAMAMDISGNISIAGDTDQNGNYDILAIQYDHAGDVLGTTLYNGPANSDDQAYAAAVSSVGQVYVAGNSTNAGGNYDFMVMRCEGAVVLAPTPFTGTAYYTHNDFTWVDNSFDADGFRMRRQTGDCASAVEENWAWVSGSPFSSATSSFQDTGLNIGSTYCYQIQAYKDSGEESRWLEKTLTTGQPPAPSDFSANAANTTRVNVNWTDNINGESGFLIQRCDQGVYNCMSPAPHLTDPSDPGQGRYTDVTTTSAGDQTYTDNSGCEGKTYTYRIQAFKTAEWDSYFSYAENVAMDAKSTPNLTSLTVQSEGSIDLAWTDSNAGETGFKIYRCAGSGCTPTIPGDFVDSTSSTSYTDAPLTPVTTYNYVVTAYKTEPTSCDGGWETVASNKLEETTNDVASGPNVPVLSTVSIDGTDVTSKINITWQDNTGTEEGFIIERCDDTKANCDVSFTVADTFTAGAEATSYSDATVCQGNTYTYRVKAKRDTAPVWTTAASNTLDAMTTAIADPTLLQWNEASSNEEDIVLNWTRNTTDETGFEIDRCEGAACDFGTKVTQTVGNGETNFTDTDRTPDTFYRYQVRAYKNSTCSWNTGYVGPITTDTEIANKGTLAITPAALNTTQIDLSWLDLTSHETGFEIQRCEGSGTACDEDAEFTVTYNLEAEVISNNDITNVCVNTEYSYRYRAVDTGGNPWQSDWSTIVAETSQNIAVPDNLGGTATSESEQNFTWTANSPDATGFHIERCEGDDTACASGPFSQIATIAGSLSLMLPMDETSWNGTADEVRDVSGSNYHGTGVNNANTVIVAGGPSGRAGSFDGDNDYVSLGDIDEFDAPTAFTLEIWFYREAETAGASANQINNVIVSQSSNGAIDNLEIGTQGTNIELYIDSASGTNEIKSVENGGAVDAGIADDTWYHIALTYDQSAADGNEIKLYLNGELVSQWDDAGGALTSSESSSFAIGISRPDGDLSGDFNGQIDLVAMHNRALTAVEVRARYGKYNDSGLSQNTWYTYRIAPYKTASCSWDENDIGYSNLHAVKTLAPPAPEELTPTVINTTQIDLTWTDKTGSNTAFELERSYCTNNPPCDAGPADPDWSAWADVSTTLGADQEAYSDTTACEGVQYKYRLRATNSPTWETDWTPDDATVIVTTPAVSVPVLDSVTRQSEVQIDLAWTWNDVTSDETGFEIDRCVGAGGGAGCDFTGGYDTLTAPADSTSYSDSGLDIETEYCYRIRAKKDAVGACGANDGWKSEYSVLTPPNNCVTTTLNDPVIGTAETVANKTTEINVNWTADIASEDGFKIFRCPELNTGTCADPANDGNYADITGAIGSAAADATAKVDNSLCVEKTYYYKVQAYNTSPEWTSNLTSGYGSATTPSITVPAMQAPVRDFETQITISWTDTNPDESYFRIERCVGDNAFCSQEPIDDNFNEINTTSDLSYPDNGLTYDTTYTYRVRAHKETTCSWDSDYSTWATMTASVLPPTNVTATVLSSTSIRVDWDDTTTTEDKFEIWRCEGTQATCVSIAGNDFGVSPITTITGYTTQSDPLSYTDEGVCPGYEYTYIVRAIRDTHWSYDSDRATSGQTVTPAAPTNLSLSEVYNPALDQRQIDLTWNDTNDDESGFEVQRCNYTVTGDCGALSGNFSTIDTVINQGAGTLNYSDLISLDPSNDYYYRVRVYKTHPGGCSEWNDLYSEITNELTNPAKPAGLIATPSGSLKIHLSWTDNVSDETNFVIEKKMWNNVWVLLNSTGAGTTEYVDTEGLNPNTSYVYRIRSYRSTDMSYSPYSEEASATTDPYGAQWGDDTTCLPIE